jgi:hypothetical protein
MDYIVLLNIFCVNFCNGTLFYEINDYTHTQLMLDC